MNRIVLIGNGFDLAHGLKTSYANFINWYWKDRFMRFSWEEKHISMDYLCTFKRKDNEPWYYFYNRYHVYFDKCETEQDFFSILEREGESIVEKTPFMERICNSIYTKGWVDIENEYYNLLIKYAIEKNYEEYVGDLNIQLNFLKDKLVEYLKIVDKQSIPNDEIRNYIYAPISPADISIESQTALKEYVNSWMAKNESFVYAKIQRYGLDVREFSENIVSFRKGYKEGIYRYIDVPRMYLLPDAIILLSFNYTRTAQLYHNEDISFINYIHGNAVDNPQSIIFGYGDELDDNFKQLQNLNENECLNNIKSIKYLEADNYRYVLSFMESEPFQVYIMGHSCGNSDRTLLNTLFEHKNCISIKPFYYQKEDGTDNYMEIVQNISRNFTDMKLMRDRVVNKTKCEALPQIKRK